MVDFIRGLREKAQMLGVKSTFSYRCIISLKKLQGTLDLEVIMKIAILKGLDNDVIATIIPDGYSKYHKAMKGMVV